MRIRYAIAPAVLVVTSAVSAGAATINFDGAANGTVINNFYSALGVTFACSDGNFPGVCNADGDGANVYAIATTINNSAPNVISTHAGIPGERVNLTGVIEATFAAPVTNVSLDAFLLLSPEGFGTPGSAFLSAFNGATFLGSASTSTVETWQTLSLSFANITHVRFSSTVGNYPSYGVFDNLVFTGGTTPDPPDPTPTPEPASILLLGSSVLGLTLGRKRLSS